MTPLEQRRAAYIQQVTAEVSAQIPPQRVGRSEVLDTFLAMTKEARKDALDGPASETVVYSCIDLLSRDGLESQVINTAYRVLRNPEDKAKVKKGFETAIVAANLLTSQSKQK